MIDLLLLGPDAENTHELATLFQSAGYQVIEVKDLVSCWSRLKDELRPSNESLSIHKPGVAAAAAPKGVTIFNAGSIGENPAVIQRQPQLLSYILTLARQLTPGWRLSMRHRRLEAPNGGTIPLTSLEFTFIKIFALVDVGEAVSRKQIVQAFGEDYLSYDQNRIDTMVRRLRKKIEAVAGVKLPLNTERVRGFSFGDILIIDQ